MVLDLVREEMDMMVQEVLHMLVLVVMVGFVLEGQLSMDL
jgi:hypothetical protein